MVEQLTSAWAVYSQAGEDTTRSLKNGRSVEDVWNEEEL